MTKKKESKKKQAPAVEKNYWRESKLVRPGPKEPDRHRIRTNVLVIKPSGLLRGKVRLTCGYTAVVTDLS